MGKYRMAIFKIMSSLREQLHKLCKEYIDSGLTAATEAIENAREASRNETKSSAGDKYETAREMMQQDINLNNLRIAEMKKLSALLDMISHQQPTGSVQAGSVVRTSQGNYYTGISIGKLKVDDVIYFTLSLSAPLGVRLAGKKAGEQFIFNGKEFVIQEVL